MAETVMQRKIFLLFRFVYLVLRYPGHFDGMWRELRRHLRQGGIVGLKHFILYYRPAQQKIWANYTSSRLHRAQPLCDIADNWTARPLISVLMPTYNTPPQLLRDAINSVLAQWYRNWELCIADDGSTEPGVAQLLEEYAARDSRIKLSLTSKNGNVSVASNRALALACGDFITLLDHDDLLEPQALFRLADTIIEDNPDFIYSDEVMVDETAEKLVFWSFRPGFSLERLRNHPYIVHLVCFRASLLRQIGGFDERLAISQDYDLILRVVEQSQRIVHIPEVLYRWRQRKSSLGHRKQSEVEATSRQVLEGHLRRTGLSVAKVESRSWFNYYRVVYPLPEGHRVAIVIPTRDRHDLVEQCVRSIKKTVSGVSYDIVLIDHESDNVESLAWFEQFARSAPNHRLLRHQGAFNFSSINNAAIRSLGQQYSHYLLCNNDIEALEAGWLDAMLRQTWQPDVGAVGALLVYGDQQTVQHAGVCVGLCGAAEHYSKFLKLRLEDGRRDPGFIGTLIINHEVNAATAACLLIRREVFEQVGGFCEKIAVGFGDVDFCLRIREAGYRVIQCQDALLVHHESISRGKGMVDPHPQDSAFYRNRWARLLCDGDPYYSPGLVLHGTNWHVRKNLSWEQFPKRRIFQNNRFTFMN